MPTMLVRSVSEAIVDWNSAIESIVAILGLSFDRWMLESIHGSHDVRDFMMLKVCFEICKRLFYKIWYL